MTEQEIKTQYNEALARVDVWCDEYHRHSAQCLKGDARDIALIEVYRMYHSLRERVRNLKVEV